MLNRASQTGRTCLRHFYVTGGAFFFYFRLPGQALAEKCAPVGALFPAPSLGCPIELIFTNFYQKSTPITDTIYTKGCFPVCNRPWDVSGVVNRPSGINFPLEISRNGHANNGKLIFQQISLSCIRFWFLLLLWHDL